MGEGLHISQMLTLHNCIFIVIEILSQIHLPGVYDWSLI